MPSTSLLQSFVREMGISTAPLALPKVAVSLNAINLHNTPHGEESRPAITAQPDGTATEETDRTWGLPCPSQAPLTKQRLWKSRKNGEYLFLQVLYAVSRANQKKNKTNQERLMNKNNRLFAFLLVISPPQTAVMWKVLKFKSHLSLTSADRLPMQ